MDFKNCESCLFENCQDVVENVLIDNSIGIEGAEICGNSLDLYSSIDNYCSQLTENDPIMVKLCGEDQDSLCS